MEFPATPLSTPDYITFEPDGNFWFNGFYGSHVGRITPAGVITEFPLPDPNSKPYGITPDPKAPSGLPNRGPTRSAELPPPRSHLSPWRSTLETSPAPLRTPTGLSSRARRCRSIRVGRTPSSPFEALAGFKVTGGCNPGDVLPEHPGHPRPDGGLPPEVHARIGLRAGRLHGCIHGRFVSERVRGELDRAALGRGHHRGGAGEPTIAPTTPTRAARWQSSWSRRPAFGSTDPNGLEGRRGAAEAGPRYRPASSARA